jgi:hypothetical protein
MTGEIEAVSCVLTCEEVTEMKRVTVLVPVLALLMLLGVAPAISVAHASPLIMATGTVTAGNYAFTGERTADGNTFLTGTFDADTFSGTFLGTAPNVFRLILNPSGLNVQIFFKFTGTVKGIPGTLVIKFQGNGEGIGMPIKGKWVILSLIP